MSRDERGGIGVLGAIFLVLVFALGALATAALAAVVSSLSRSVAFEAALQGVRADPLLASVSVLGGAVLAIAAATWRAGAGDEEAGLRDSLSLYATPAVHVVLAVTAGFTLAFPLQEVGNLLTAVFSPGAVEGAILLRQSMRIDSISDALLVPLSFVVLPAVGEELLFRGVLLPGLSVRVGSRLGIGLSALLFGLIHVEPIAIACATLAGLALGYVRVRTGSVLPAVALHGAINAAPIALPAEIVRITGFNTFGPEVAHLPLPLAVGGFAVGLVSLLALGRLTD